MCALMSKDTLDIFFWWFKHVNTKYFFLYLESLLKNKDQDCQINQLMFCVF